MYRDVGEQERPIWYQTYHRNDIPWIFGGYSGKDPHVW